MAKALPSPTSHICVTVNPVGKHVSYSSLHMTLSLHRQLPPRSQPFFFLQFFSCFLKDNLKLHGSDTDTLSDKIKTPLSLPVPAIPLFVRWVCVLCAGGDHVLCRRRRLHQWDPYCTYLKKLSMIYRGPSTSVLCVII